MLYQKNREGEQGNPFRAGPTGPIPEGPQASRGGAEAPEEPPVNTTHSCTRPPRRLHAHMGAQAGPRMCVLRWVCAGLFISRFPNHRAPSKGPGPLSSGRDALGPPRGSFFVPISRRRLIPFPAPAGTSTPRPATRALGSFPPSELRFG